MEKIKIADTDILVCVDMQRDFINGALGSKDAQAIVPHVCCLIRAFKKAGSRILLTRDVHPVRDTYPTIESLRVPTHCIKNTEGAGINSEISLTIADYEDCHVCNKDGFMFLEWRNEVAPLKETRIFICGLVTDICVVSNALALRSINPHTPMYCVADCCAGLTPDKHKAALEVMKSCLIDIVTLDGIEGC